MAQTTITIRLKGAGRAKARLWLSLKLLRLFAAICPCRVEIEGP